VAKLDEYLDPRLVEQYHLENPRGPDADFYVQLAAELDAHRIIDLGCGTGLLTRELAIPGREVIGVDPSPAMLAFARRQPRAGRVRWVEGEASAIGTLEADLLVMTGNVAQVFVDDAGWLATLKAIHSALRPGGYLSFESRNPQDRAWERWNRPATYGRFESSNGPTESWVEFVSLRDGQVTYEAHNVFLSTGEDVVVRSTLRFRTLEELSRSLTASGFATEHVYGAWGREPLLETSRLMIFVARRA
jgi:SAM-dependent methyltransferase